MDDYYVGKHSKRFHRQRRSPTTPLPSEEAPRDDGARASSGVRVLEGSAPAGEGTDAPEPVGAGILVGTGVAGPGTTATATEARFPTATTPDSIGWNGDDARTPMFPAPGGNGSGGPGYPTRKAEHVRTTKYRAHRWVRTLSVLVVVLAILIAGGVGGLYLYAQQVWQAIPRIGTDDLSLEEKVPGEPTTFMIVGSDTREGLPKDLQKMVGSASKVGGQRADTIMLIHVDPDLRKSFVLSLPRDLRVKVDGRGYDKVNSAYNDGPQTLVNTVQTFTGLEINHYAEIDFESFRRIVDAIGGIEYDFANAVRDTKLKYTWNAGPKLLNGDEALSLVRSRHFQEKIDGRWVADGKGDLGRIERQQEFILKMLAKVSGPGSLANVNEYAQIAEEYVVIDENFDLQTALDLFRDMTPVTPDRVEFVSLPGKNTSRNGVAYIESIDETEIVLARLRGETVNGDEEVQTIVTGVVPGDVTVRVLNGTRRSGLAAGARDFLAGRGYQVSGIADGPTTVATEIVYEPGQAEKAELVARELGVGIVKVGSGEGAEVSIYLGDDFPDLDILAARAPGA